MAAEPRPGGASRELVVLGTASQAPTRRRNHNGYLLRWDDEAYLFDPGEGTQRQLLLAGVPAIRITHICITHFHGDHCLGLSGILQRISLDQGTRPIDLCYPASGAPYVERLRFSSAFERAAEVRQLPVTHDGLVPLGATSRLQLTARHLDHRVETVGWRVEEPDGRHFLTDRLAALGIRGPDVGRLEREGSLTLSDGRQVGIDDVTERRAGQSAAVVMDTRLCDNAFALAADVDLLVCEATYLEAERQLAHDHGHLTAGQAATIAREAGARLLVLTHFSSRYPDAGGHLEEASKVFPEVVVVDDLDRVPVPHRG